MHGNGLVDEGAEPTAPDEASRFRMEQGQEIGALARRDLSRWILVTSQDGKTVYEITGELIADTGHTTLHEAAFTSGPFVAKADILQRDSGFVARLGGEIELF